MNLRRTMAVTAAALLLLAGACGNDDSPAVDSGSDTDATTTTTTPKFAAGTTMANLQAKGKIVVGTKFDQPLFGLKNAVTGEVEGFDVEIAKLIAVGIFGGDAKSVASKIEFKETVSKNREPFIQNGEVDFVVATYTINDTRKQLIDFAGPYYEAGQDIMVASGNPEGLEGPDDLKNGNVQAVTTDNVILTGLVAGSPDDFELVGNPFTEEPYGIGLTLGDTEFRNFINDVLEDAFEDGSWADAWDRTAGAITGTEAPEPPSVDRY